MFKKIIRSILQQWLGFDRYVFWLAIIQITRMRFLGYDKEFLHFCKLIQPDGAILDIGANIGITAVVLAKKHPDTILYAIEPLPHNIHALKRVIDFFQLKNVIIIETALGDEQKQVNMVVPVTRGATMQGLAYIQEDVLHEKMTGHVFSVGVQQLDQLPSPGLQTKISAIKIDVENYELYVLRGGRVLLEKYRPIVFCELWDDERRLLCFALMKELGYRIKVWERGQLVDFNEQESLNYFFLPETKA